MADGPMDQDSAAPAALLREKVGLATGRAVNRGVVLGDHVVTVNGHRDRTGIRRGRVASVQRLPFCRLQ